MPQKHECTIVANISPTQSSSGGTQLLPCCCMRTEPEHLVPSCCVNKAFGCKCCLDWFCITIDWEADRVPPVHSRVISLCILAVLFEVFTTESVYLSMQHFSTHICEASVETCSFPPLFSARIEDVHLNMDTELQSCCMKIRGYNVGIRKCSQRGRKGGRTSFNKVARTLPPMTYISPFSVTDPKYALLS